MRGASILKFAVHTTLPRFSATTPDSQAVKKSFPTEQPVTWADSLAVRDQTYVVLDIETTGFESRPDTQKPVDEQDHDLIEVSAIKYHRGKSTGSYWSLAKPNRPIPEEVVQITGITDKMVANASSQTKVLWELAAFVGKKPLLVGHNIKRFDIRFIRGCLEKLGFSELKERFNYDTAIDTLPLSYKLLPNLPDYKAGTVAQALGIKNPRAHRAQNDVKTSARTWFKLIQLAKKQGKPFTTLGELFRFQFDAKTKLGKEKTHP